MSIRTDRYKATGGVQPSVVQPATTPTTIGPQKDYSGHEYTVQEQGPLSNLGKDTLLNEPNSATGNFQAKSLHDSQNLQGVSNTANHLSENILHSNHASNAITLDVEKKLSPEMEELQSKIQEIETKLETLQKKIDKNNNVGRLNGQLLKTQGKLIDELSSLKHQELTLSMEESKDKADDIAQSKFQQVTNTNPRKKKF